MIILTRLDNSEFYLAATMIETIEETPNTVITVTNGKKYIVKESAQEVTDKIVSFYRRIYNGIPLVIREDIAGEE